MSQRTSPARFFGQGWARHLNNFLHSFFPGKDPRSFLYIWGWYETKIQAKKLVQISIPLKNHFLSDLLSKWDRNVGILETQFAHKIVPKHEWPRELKTLYLEMHVRFKSFKLLTGLLSPYIFLTKNMLLRNWSLCTQTCYIAIFSSIEPPRPVKLSFFLYLIFFFVFLFYIHFDRKGIQYRFTVWISW